MDLLIEGEYSRSGPTYISLGSGLGEGECGRVKTPLLRSLTSLTDRKITQSVLK